MRTLANNLWGAFRRHARHLALHFGWMTAVAVFVVLLYCFGLALSATVLPEARTWKSWHEALTVLVGSLSPLFLAIAGSNLESSERQMRLKACFGLGVLAAIAFVALLFM